MIETINQISELTFALLFAAISVVGIIIGKLLINADGTNRYPFPELKTFDPLAIALLRGGVGEVVKTALFNLWCNGLVSIRGVGRSRAKIVSTFSDRHTPQDGVESSIYQFTKNPSTPLSLTKEPFDLERIEKHLETTYQQLEDNHLIRTGGQVISIWVITLILLAIIGGIGGARLYSIVNQQNVIEYYVIAVLVLSVLATFFILKPWEIPTQLGKRYLVHLKQECGWFKTALKSQGEMQKQSTSPVYAVALFGVDVLVDTEFAPFERALAPIVPSTTGEESGGGCGG